MSAQIDLGLGHVAIARPKVRPSLGDRYGEREGLAPLRRAVAAIERVPVDHVAITTGAALGLAAALAALDRPGSILVPRPYYPLYPRLAELLGFAVDYYALDATLGWNFSPDRLAQCIGPQTRAILLTLPGNPTGNVPTVRALETLEVHLRRLGIVLISDEAYGDFVYRREALPDIAALFPHNDVVRIRSFSKVLGIPGERVGYVVARPSQLQRVVRAHWALGMSPPFTSQRIALDLLSSDYARRRTRLRACLAQNRQAAITLLHTSRLVRVQPPAGGIFLWLDVSAAGRDSRAFAKLCAAAGVIVAPGADFGIDDHAYIRVCMGMTRRLLLTGLRRVLLIVQRSGASL
jgi:(5-formylfuran-3-yl)methyl phosphate transaminase